MSDSRRGVIALSSVPATVATSTGLAVHLISHSTGLACGLAALSGLLTLLTVAAASSEVHRTIRHWISSRPQILVASAESFERRRVIKAATAGRRWSVSSAERVRAAAAAYPLQTTSLREVLLLSRTAPLPTDLLQAEPGELEAAERR